MKIKLACQGTVVNVNLLQNYRNGSANGGKAVPLFNHFNAKDWIVKRAAYNKED